MLQEGQLDESVVPGTMQSDKKCAFVLEIY